jgi:hypothetical protein
MNLNRWLDSDFIDGIIHRLQDGFTGKEVYIC